MSAPLSGSAASLKAGVRTPDALVPGRARLVEVRPFQPGEEEEWDRFVLSSASGTFFQLSGWNAVVERCLGHRSVSLIARNEHGVSGVFPISWVRNLVFGDCLVSSPLAVYGGICADDAETYYALLNAGSELAERLGVRYLEMRNRREPFATSLPGRNLYVTFTQDLSPGPEKLYQRLPKKTRYEVRIGQKAGLQWVETTDLREFYEIYAHNVHRLGTPVFDRNLFVQLRERFPQSWRLFTVRKDNRAIATAFCCYFNGSVMPLYVGSLKEFYRDSPNNFMYWSLMEQSCREGLSEFDFGRSKRGTGSFQFKTTWAMQIDELPYRYRLVRATEVPQMSPVDRKFRLPVEVWKRLPFGLTKFLGPKVIRSVPSV
jgi:FemAB-related protein (PEP-CTERM system-associated)